MREVKKERTGWRDMGLSERHRHWGWDCPAVDLDFLFLEYDKGKAVALVEYKHERASRQKLSHPSMRAIAELATRAWLPFFGVRYKEDFSSWDVTAVNENALEVIPHRKQVFTERGYVLFLYKLRGRDKIPEDVLERISCN